MGLAGGTPEGTIVRWRDRAGRWAFGRVSRTGRTYVYVDRGERVTRVRMEEAEVWHQQTSTNDQSED